MYLIYMGLSFYINPAYIFCFSNLVWYSKLLLGKNLFLSLCLLIIDYFIYSLFHSASLIICLCVSSFLSRRGWVLFSFYLRYLLWSWILYLHVLPSFTSVKDTCKHFLQDCFGGDEVFQFCLSWEDLIFFCMWRITSADRFFISTFSPSSS